jgi:pyridoxal phosphate enzyme (YggS family)
MNYIDVNFKSLKKYIKNIVIENNLLIKKINIIAVSKNQNIDIIKQAILSGINNFGENYLQESISKIIELKKYKNINWHFIGKIQSNKTKTIAQYFDWCQTIDQEKSAILLNKYRLKKLTPMNVLIQINISRESNKNGVNNIQECHQLAKTISLMPNLHLRGIMAMPKINKDFIETQNQYKKIKIIFDELKKQYTSIDTLSLGTSYDIKESLLATSNMIRIGRNIFHKQKCYKK